LGTAVLLPGVMRPKSDVDHHLQLAPRWKLKGAIGLLPPIRLHDVDKDNLTFTLYIIQSIKVHDGFRQLTGMGEKEKIHHLTIKRAFDPHTQQH
jgi:hypothetical protein